MSERGDALLDVIWEVAYDFSICEIGTDGIARANCEHLGITWDDVCELEAWWRDTGEIAPAFPSASGALRTLLEAAGIERG